MTSPTICIHIWLLSFFSLVKIFKMMEITVGEMWFMQYARNFPASIKTGWCNNMPGVGHELVENGHLLLILILDRSMCPDGVRIVGRWCSTPCTEAKETLDSVPIELRFYSRPVCSTCHINFTHVTPPPLSPSHFSLFSPYLPLA